MQENTIASDAVQLIYQADDTAMRLSGDYELDVELPQPTQAEIDMFLRLLAEISERLLRDASSN